MAFENSYPGRIQVDFFDEVNRVMNHRRPPINCYEHEVVVVDLRLPKMNSMLVEEDLQMAMRNSTRHRLKVTMSTMLLLPWYLLTMLFDYSTEDCHKQQL